MSDLDELLGQLPMGEIARRLGVDEETADDAVRQVLPGLVGGMSANVENGGGDSLARALAGHVGDLPSPADVDTDDGERIVHNVFGGSTGQVASRLADNSPKSSVTSGLIQQLLPILAPIVLSWLASRFLGGKTGGAAAAPAASSGGLGDLLGGLLGGSSSSSGASGGLGGGLGDLLGGLLGGGKR
jgi:hypothetical protein